MKKLLVVATGFGLALSTVSFAQDSSAQSSGTPSNPTQTVGPTSTNKTKKSKKAKKAPKITSDKTTTTDTKM